MQIDFQFFSLIFYFFVNYWLIWTVFEINNVRCSVEKSVFGGIDIMSKSQNNFH